MGWEFFGLLLIVVMIGVLVGAVFGFIAFAQLSGLKSRISVLEEQVRSAAGTTDLRRETPPAPAQTPRQTTTQTVPRATQDDTARRPATPGDSARPAARPPATPPTAPARPKQDWEKLVAASWMVWVGGLALAVGGLLLVRVAIDAGLFGPAVRTAGAAVLGAALIGAGLWSEAKPLVRRGDGMVKRLPEILSAAGVISLYGAAIGAGLLYTLVPPLIALTLLVIVCAVAVSLSLKYGRLLAALGLTGAYIAPMLTGAPSGSALPLLPYAAAISVAGLVLIHWQSWRFLTWLTLAGAAFWGLVAIAAADPGMETVVPLYALALAGVGIGLGQGVARIIPTLKGFSARQIISAAPESLFAAHGYWLLAGALILLVGNDVGARIPVTASLGLFGAAGLLATRARPGFSLLAPLAGLATVAALILWTRWQPELEPVALALGIGFGVAGTLLMQTARFKAPLAATAAIMPPAALFIAFWKGNDLEPGFVWALGAAAMACALAIMIDRFRQADGSLDKHPGAVSAYAVGAGLSAMLAPFLLLEDIWLGPAMAVVALVLAAVWKRFPLFALRLAGMAATTLSVFLMVRPGMLREQDISPTPILNELTFSFAVAIGALVAAAWLTRGVGKMARGFETGASLLGFAFVGLTIRHIAGDGNLWGPFAGMGEASGYAIAYLGAAVSLAWRAPGKSWIWRGLEYVTLFVGVMAVLIAMGQIGDEPVGNLFVFNLLLPAFAMPALLLGAYGIAVQRDGRTVLGQFASTGAMLLGFVWVTCEVLRTVGSPMLTGTDQDLWAFSLGWILYAFGLLVWGVARNRPFARYGSLAVLLLAVLKVFLVDLATLEGIARAGSFIGLGAALILIALFYQRFVFRQTEQKGPSPLPES